MRFIVLLYTNYSCVVQKYDHLATYRYYFHSRLYIVYRLESKEFITNKNIIIRRQMQPAERFNYLYV